MPKRQRLPLARVRARDLRSNMSDAERRLWYLLRRHGVNGVKFRRQHPVGPYILDFHCAQARLGVELDGGQHFEAEGEAYDRRRTRFLEGQGVQVLRFTNLEALKQTDAVLEAILRTVMRRTGSDPSP